MISQKMSETLQYTCAIFVLLVVASICVSDHTCWSNDCSAGEEFCVQECHDSEKQCLANYVSHSNGTVSATLFSCIPEENEDCNVDACVPVGSEGGVFSCCCTGDLCNEIQGLTPGSVATDPSFTTSIPTRTIPVRPPSHQICEFYNCSLVTDPTTQSCYHGYEVCAETSVGMLFDHDDHYCQALYRFNSTKGLYELFTKGCQYGIPRCADSQECFVDTDRGDPFLHCCCDGQLCNVNVTFTDPSRVVPGGLTPGSVVCPKGFFLSDEDQASCIDVNECLTGAHLCEEPATCYNEEGTYRCECDATKSLRIADDGLSCEHTGLVCERFACNQNDCLGGVDYCDDRFLADEMIDAQYCQATYQLDRTSALPEPRLLTCFISARAEGCTHGYCDLQYVSEDLLFCCCTGNLCNTNVTFPDTSEASPTHSPGLTDLSVTTSIPTETIPVRPPSPLSISFTGDTPRVVGNAITVEISLSRRTRSAICRLGDTIIRDCFNGTTFRDVPPGKHTIRIKARNSRLDRATVTRKIEIGSELGFCSTHLINDGVTVDGSTVTVEFGSVGPALSFSCWLDSQPSFSCTSPVVLEDVDAGLHRLRITTGGRSPCSTMHRQSIRFVVPRQ